ncbi:uncharacterized protein [Apostichopus japonicus]|uniref:uncharacterized protein isoform X32 n=1 Tax=Stichopus japonicus TaxID=307972 RepID=UPI003AB830EB
MMRLLLLLALAGLAYTNRVSEPRTYSITTPNEYYWFPTALPSRPCTIHFQIKASRDAVISFSPEKQIVQDIYEIVIGAEGNLFLCIRRGNGEAPILDQLAFDILTGEWQDFWVELCNGVVIVEGLDENAERVQLARWQDDEPYTANQWYVGLTSMVEGSEWRFVDAESCGIDGEDNDIEEREERERENNNRRDRQRDEATRLQDEREREARERRRRLREERQRSSGSGSSSNTRPGSGSRNSNGPRRGSGSGSSSNTGPRSGTSDSNGPRRGSGSGSSSNTGPRSRTSNSNGPRRGSGSGSSSNTGPRSGTSVSNGPRRGSGSGSSSNTGRGSGTRNSNGPRRGSGSVDSSNSRRRGSGTSRSNDRARNAQPAPRPDNGDKIEKDIQGNFPAEWTFIEWKLRNPSGFKIPFWLKAEGDAYIRLSATNADSATNFYTIMIGFRSNRNVCIMRSGRNVVDEPIRGVLDRDDFVYFELEWDGRTIKLWKEGQLLVEYTDRDPYSGLDWIGFTSYDSVNPSNRIPSRWKFERNSFGSGSGSSSNTGPRSGTSNSNGPRRGSGSGSNSNTGPGSGTSNSNGPRRGSGSGSSSNTGPRSGSRNSNGPRRGSGSGSSSNTGPRSGSRNSNGPRRGSGSGSSSNTGPRSGTSVSNGPRRGSGSGSSSNTGRGSGTRNSNGPRRGSGSGSSSNTGRGSGTRNSNGPRRGSGSVDSSNSRRRGSGTSRSNDRARNAQPAPRPDNGDIIEKDIQGNFPAEWTFIEWKLRNPSGFKIPFWLKAEGDAYIRLSATNADSATNFYTIMIGFRSNRNVCIMRSGRNVVDEPIRGVLDRDDFVYFELEWDGRTIKLWKEGQLLVEYTDRDPYSGLDWIGFTSYDSVNPSNRIPSRWKFERNSFGSGSGSSSNTGRGSGSSNSNGRRRGSGSGSSSNSGPGSGTSNSNGRRRGSGSGSSSNTGPGSETIDSNGPGRDNGDKIEKEIRGNSPAEWTFIEGKLLNPSRFKITFWLKAEGDAHIRLSATNNDNSNAYYEIMIGFRNNNNVCIVRSGRSVVDDPIPGVLSRELFIEFELEWDGRSIKLWKGGRVLVEYTDRDPCRGLDWIGFTSYDSINPSNRIPSRWKFEKNSFAISGAGAGGGGGGGGERWRGSSRSRSSRRGSSGSRRGSRRSGGRRRGSSSSS